ncbi:MAG: undecaprenyldiphospho-muramoylpentapeptide beta-N-acetylglucosaminyltransferase [Rikenellaceae bacterium]
MYRVIVSGGGTGGHIYPAVSVAEALKSRFGSEVEILFVGAEGRMEMELVPSLGYRIEGLPIAGLQRRLEWRNLLLPFKVVRSIFKARSVIKGFNADIVVGFGGYASAPILWAAQRLGVPTIVQEQNSYAGVTNRVVGGAAKRVCVAYSGMERFFKGAQIVLTGNPLRGSFGTPSSTREEALGHYDLDGERPVVLVVGGSLGTRTLNTMMCRWIESLGGERPPVQVIWQTGRYYEAEMRGFLNSNPVDGVWQGAFLNRMDLAYQAADIVISRSGASTVSELALMGKATIFVPSPNVAEDHQTANAMALVNEQAALMVRDSEAAERAMRLAVETLKDSGRVESLSENIKRLAHPDAAQRVVDQIVEVLKDVK